MSKTTSLRRRCLLHSSEKGIVTHGKTQSLFESPKISDFHHPTMAPLDNTKIKKLGLK
jgi:hypothetical protein